MGDTTNVKSTTNENQAIIDAAKSFGAARYRAREGRTDRSVAPRLPQRKASSVRQAVSRRIPQGARAQEGNGRTDVARQLHRARQSAQRQEQRRLRDRRIPKSPSLLAVYDYNHGGEKGDPRFGQHRASYSFPLSDEWQAWMRAGALEAMTQEAFAG